MGLPIRPGRPAFLGAIVQAFKLYAGAPKPGYKLWMDRLPKEILARLKPMMQRHEKKDSLYLPASSKTIAIEIPDFNQLAPLMQEAGKAVFNLSQKDTARITPTGKPWVGNNWTQAKDRMQDYKECFATLAKIIRDFDK
ncbi:MAG: hypothetical protein J0M17_25750 [Planctomycetes bacterium]|nr:hypothetical protein [Planctomycetota bacterium]